MWFVIPNFSLGTRYSHDLLETLLGLGVLSNTRIYFIQRELTHYPEFALCYTVRKVLRSTWLRSREPEDARMIIVEDCVNSAN